jgi:thioester reductase-like protein
MAMVRAVDDAGASERMPLKHAQLVVVCGDLSLDRFGWTATQWRARQRMIGAVLHNGAAVNAALAVDELRAVNVGGTATVLRLVGRSRKPLVLVSTIGVLQPSSGYSKSKLEAEQLVQRVRAQLALPAVIVRPGAIGPARTGESNPIDFRILLMREMLKQRASPHSIEAVPLRMIGVETVAQRAVEALALERDAVLPVVAERAVPWSAVINHLAHGSADFRRGIDWSEWRRAVADDSLRALLGAGGLGVAEPIPEAQDNDDFAMQKMCDWLKENV